MISAVVLTKNSAQYLARCLASLSSFAEVVVLDNGSTDNTIAIASEFSNVIVHTHEFCGFGKLKNIAANFAQNDWVFFLDSDEILHPRLVKMIHEIPLNTNSVYSFKRNNYYNNFLIDGCSWGNDWVVRLYNKTRTQYNLLEVHESIMCDNMQVEVVKPGFIYHFPYQTVGELTNKLQFYSELYARTYLGKKRVRLWSIIPRTVLAFIKNYILKRGFMYGYEGLTISTYNAMGVFSKYIKLYELSNRKSIALAIMVNRGLNEIKCIIDYVNAQNLLPVKLFILVDDNSLLGYGDDLKQFIDDNLVVPYKVISIACSAKSQIYQEISKILNTQLQTDQSLSHIAYVNDYIKLSNPHLLRKIACKSAIPNSDGKLFLSSSY